MSSLGVVVVLAASVASVDTSRLNLGAELDRVQHGQVLYVALASGGVAVVDVRDSAAPLLAGRIADGRSVARLFVQDGELCLVELRQEMSTWSLDKPLSPARSLGLALPRVPNAPSAPPIVSVPGAAREARVVEVRRGRAIFDAGAAEGFVPGAHVRIISQRLESKPSLTGEGTSSSPSGEVTAVIRIEQAEPHRSMALLGRGNAADPADLAALTQEPLSERVWVPRRSPFAALVGFHARPFLGLDGSKAFGILADAYATYYLPNIPMALGVSAAPVGLTLGASEKHYPMTFALIASYATDYFEIGLGAGALVGSPGPCNLIAPGRAACEPNTGLTINQQLRLGALDGVNLIWRSSIFSRPDRFVFGVGRGELNVPLTSYLGLFGAGGGGENGWNFGEFGVRTMIGGSGARGTKIISASLGYASIFDGANYQSVGGPSVAIGVEWRL